MLRELISLGGGFCAGFAIALAFGAFIKKEISVAIEPRIVAFGEKIKADLLAEIKKLTGKA
jgi:hypothetical protein